MSIKRFCDLCNAEIDYIESVRVTMRVNSKEYCYDCWKDKKNWKVIHSNEFDKNP